MSKTRLTVCLVLISLFAFSLSGCSRNEKDTYCYVAEIISEHPSMPSGRFYEKEIRDVNGIEIEQLDGYLAFSLYGDSSRDIILTDNIDPNDLYPEEFKLIKDFCIWLSSTFEPYEISVFRLHSSGDATAVAKMLIRRLDKLKKYWKESAYYTELEGCTVRIDGNLVILEVLPSSQASSE